MHRTGVFLSMSLSVVLSASAAVSARPLPENVIDTEIGSDWNQAAGVAVAPDGRLFVWERAGLVWTVENGVKSAAPILDISEEVTTWWDRGMLGFALDPGFATNGHLYLLYVVDHHHLMNFGTPAYDPLVSNPTMDTISRLTRYTCNAADGFRSIDPASRRVLIGESASTGILCVGASHSSGSLVFGHDGSLLISHGESAYFGGMDDGGPRPLTTRTAIADGIMRPDEDVGAFRAQMVDSMGGKILRVDPATGDGLATNPFFDPANPRSARSRVWALGFRNPFRFTVRPGADHASRHEDGPGALYVGDVGWDQREELSVVTAPGQNFGWPLFEGFRDNIEYRASEAVNLNTFNSLFGVGACDEPHYRFRDLLIEDTLNPPFWPNPCDGAVEIEASAPRFMHTRPRVEWGHGVLGVARVPTYVGGEAATALVGEAGSGTDGEQFHGNSSTGGAWFAAVGWPPEFAGYYHADFQDGWMRRFTFDDQHRCTEIAEFLDAEQTHLIVDIESDPAGTALYYVAFDILGTSSVHRLTYASDLPPVVSATAEPAFGPLPLSVRFSASGSLDPESQPLSYLWDFGDGSPPSTEPDPVHVYEVPGAGTEPMRFDASVVVTDEGGNSVTKRFVISPNNTPPMVELLYPADGAMYEMLTTVNFDSVTAISDAESPNDLRCEWRVLLHHNQHIHPQPVDENCQTSFSVFSHGSDPTESYYEFRLTVTDAQGLATVRTASMYPRGPIACPGDADGDGQVGLSDLALVIQGWQSFGVGTPGDVTLDGRVTIADLTDVVQNWDAACQIAGR